MRVLHHAFVLDDYPVDGLTSGEFHVYGQYLGPHGVGTLRIDDGKAYGEPFPVATANLRFEGAGVRLDKIEIRKGTGTVTGAAWVAWDGNYSFDANGTKVPVESLATLSIPRAPLSGVLGFDATGTGTFDAPRYDVTARVDDLFAGDEGIGQLVGHLALRGQMLSLDFEAQSKRLSVSGAGRLARTPEMDADFTFRFNDTSLDPYLRFFAPKIIDVTKPDQDLGWREVVRLRVKPSSKRRTRSGFLVNSAGRSLMATLRSSFVSWASQTSPMPPAPSGGYLEPPVAVRFGMRTIGVVPFERNRRANAVSGTGPLVPRMPASQLPSSFWAFQRLLAASQTRAVVAPFSERVRTGPE